MNDYRPPTDETFGDDEFLESPVLAELARSVIDRLLPELNDGVLEVHYAWKRVGGSSGGNATLGKCVRLTGLTKHFANGPHFVIWLAADHFEDFGLDEDAVEAIIFHELCHIQVLEEGEYRVRGHDCELFIEELRHYPNRPGLDRVIEAAKRAEQKVQAGQYGTESDDGPTARALGLA